jgi:hypothetical protein
MPQHPSLTAASAGFPKGQRPFGHSAAKKAFLGFAEAFFTRERSDRKGVRHRLGAPPLMRYRGK